MAIRATGQVTIVDITDVSQLSIQLSANLPATQIYDQVQNTKNPDWSQTQLIITPTILLNQKVVDAALLKNDIRYTQQIGTGVEETPPGAVINDNGQLIITTNMLSLADPFIKYSCYITYQDSATNTTVSAKAEISFTLLLNGADGGNGEDGKSAYQLWLEAGNTGTEADYLESLKGADGKDGADGKSAYEIAQDNGFEGTEAAWLESLQGTDGIPGTSVISIVEWYCQSDSQYTCEGCEWQTTVPTWKEDKFIWTKSVITYSAGEPQETSPICISGRSGIDGTSGNDGVGVSSIDVLYCESTSNTECTGTEWNTEAPEWESGKYIWSKTRVIYSDGNQTESDAVCITGQDGQTTYFHIKYSTKEKPLSTSDMTDTPNVYIGTYVDFTKEDSADPTKYTWTKFQGSDGADGTPGTNGIDGKTYYLHIAYANSADGTEGFSTTESLNKLYIGQYTSENSGDSTNPSDYHWTLIKGKDGKDGADGSDGRGIATITNYYLATSLADGVTITTTGWTDKKQNPTADKQYLWNYEQIVYTDTTVVTTPPCIIGVFSIGIESVTITYQTSTDGDTPPDTWLPNIPPVAEGHYLWTRTLTTLTDKTETESFTVARMGINGTNGTNGSNGVGIASTVIDYAVGSSGKDAPDSGWQENVPEADEGDYVWTRTTITYTDNEKSISYSVAKYGINGAAGNGIESIVEYYGLSSDKSSQPTSWDTQPLKMTATDKYLWNYEKITYTNGTYKYTEKRIIGAYGDKGNPGADGRGIVSTEVAYQAAGNGDSTPTGDWHTDQMPAVAAGQYLWTRTTITYTSGDPSISYSVSYKAKDGITITEQVVEYAVGTDGQTPPDPNTFDTTIPPVPDQQYLWTRTTTTYSDASSTIGYSVSYQSKDGINGASATNIVCGNEAQVLPCTSKGATSAATTITIPFAGYIGSARATCTVAVTGMPSGITVKTNSAATTSADGSLVLNVAADSALGGSNAGTITLTFSCNSQTFVKKFAWSKGLAGTDGLDGDSVTITTKTIKYMVNANGTQPPNDKDSNWSTDFPSSIGEGQFLWTQTYIKYSDDTETYSYSVARQGTNGGPGPAGKGVSAIKEQYFLSNSKTTPPGKTSTYWTDEMPTWRTGTYLWTRSVISWTDGSADTYTDAVLAEMINQANESANSANDTATGANTNVNNSVKQVDVEYIKTNSATITPNKTDANWSTTAPEWEEGTYIWSRQKMTTVGGATSYSKAVCITGNTGDIGIGVQSVTMQYILHNSDTQAPSKTVSGWSDSQPDWEAGKFLWVRTVVIYTDGTTKITDPILDRASNSTSQLLYNITEDGVIAASEKPDLLREWERIKSEYQSLCTSADNYGFNTNNEYISTYQQFTIAYNILATDLKIEEAILQDQIEHDRKVDEAIGSETPVEIPTVGDTIVDGKAFREGFVSYYTAKDALDLAILDFISKSLGSNGNVTTRLDSLDNTASALSNAINTLQKLSQTLSEEVEENQEDIQDILDGSLDVKALNNNFVHITDTQLITGSNGATYHKVENASGMIVQTSGTTQLTVDNSGVSAQTLKTNFMELGNLRFVNKTINGVAHTHVQWIGG